MRHYYTFAYDISDDNRQEKVRHILQQYAIGHQDSLYECWLTDCDYQAVVGQIQNILENSDCCMVFLRPETRQLLGSAKDLQYKPFIIA